MRSTSYTHWLSIVGSLKKTKIYRVNEGLVREKYVGIFRYYNLLTAERI